MGNGYAGQLLDLIRNGRSVYTVMSVYDFMVLRSQTDHLEGARLNGSELTVSDGKGTFLTNISSSRNLPDGTMQFTDRYTSNAYLLYDGLQESGYLLTENDELLIV
jgi:hypothetical protein